MGRRFVRWLPRVAVLTTGLLAAATVSLVAATLVNWNGNAAQTCLMCKPDTSMSWLCYFAIGVGATGVLVSIFLLVLPIWPQLQSMICWTLAGLFAAVSGLMTTYSLPAYSEGSPDGSWILAVYAVCWASVVVWAVLSLERCFAKQTDVKLGKLTKLQSMKSYDLESQLDAMKRTPRGEAWWSVAIKAPLDPRLGFKGTEVQYRDADADPTRPGWTVTPSFNINAWLHSHLSRDMRGNVPWTGCALYSDQPPAGQPGASAAGHGACKGVVVWNRQNVGWLIHSVPQWPPAERFLEEGSVPLLPLEHEHGSLAHSFVFVSLPLAKLREVHAQINLMQAHIYHTHQDGTYAFVPGPPPSIMINRLVLGGGLYHVAKRGEWKGDIYGDGLACKTVFGLCGGPVHVQSWRDEGSLVPNVDADNVQQSLWANGTPYPAEMDHSCWAVSAASAKHRWSFVGDLCRVEGHIMRGGGGIVIRDPSLWKTFLDTIDEWDGGFGK